MRKNTTRGATLRRVAALGLTVVAAAGLMTACSTSGSDSGKKTVGIMAWNQGNNPFGVALTKSTLDAAKKAGLDVKFVDANGDQSKMTGAVQTFITEKVDAIILYPPNATSLIAITNKAVAAGIPVLVENSGLDPAKAKYTSYVGADDVEYGNQLAELAGKALNGKGNVGLVDGILGASGQINRTKGFKATIAAKFPDIKIIAEDTDKWTDGPALAVAQNWLNKFSDMDAIVYEGPEGVSGAKWAAANGHSAVKFILGDYPSYVVSPIKDGIVYGTVNQDPTVNGKQVVAETLKVLAGKKIPRTVHIPLPIITKDNVDSSPAGW